MELKSMADPFSALPIDIIFDILTRLPLKTISQSRFVSKSWYNFIQNPRFAQLHFSRFKDDFPCAIFPTRYCSSYLIDPESLSKFETFAIACDLNLKEFRENFTISNGWNCFEIVGTVNGLVCFSPERYTYKPAPYYVVNPITREYVLIPKSPKIDVNPRASGFGFDSINNEYKIIRILPNTSKVRSEDEYETEDEEIYTLGSGIWREIQLTTNVPSLTISGMNQSNVLVHGCLHWRPQVKIESKYYDTILAFCMASEEFNLIEMPPLSEEGGMIGCFDLIVLNDCLCVIMDGGFMGIKDVWMMKKYGVHNSWVKEYKIKSLFFHSLCRGYHQVMELKNNELLLVDDERNLIYLDWKKNNANRIKLHDLKGNQVHVEPDFPVCLRGSLLSPKAIDSVRGGIYII
ncbi:hypothetical protein ACHQM5_013223 [Ranunculus cassubicifolius]